MLKTSSVVPSPLPTKSKNCARAPMAPYGSCDQGMAEWSNNGDPNDYPAVITVIGQARIARRAALKPVFSQLDPRLRRFRHAGYAVSLGLPLVDDGLHVCSEASQWRVK